MKLPIAMQNSLEESERLYSQTLERLGLTRDKLKTLATRVRASRPAARASIRAQARGKENPSCWRTI